MLTLCRLCTHTPFYSEYFSDWFSPQTRKDHSKRLFTREFNDFSPKMMFYFIFLSNHNSSRKCVFGRHLHLRKKGRLTCAQPHKTLTQTQVGDSNLDRLSSRLKTGIKERPKQILALCNILFTVPRIKKEGPTAPFIKSNSLSLSICPSSWFIHRPIDVC